MAWWEKWPAARARYAAKENGRNGYGSTSRRRRRRRGGSRADDQFRRRSGHRLRALSALRDPGPPQSLHDRDAIRANGLFLVTEDALGSRASVAETLRARGARPRCRARRPRRPRRGRAAWCSGSWMPRPRPGARPPRAARFRGAPQPSTTGAAAPRSRSRACSTCCGSRAPASTAGRHGSLRARRDAARRRWGRTGTFGPGSPASGGLYGVLKTLTRPSTPGARPGGRLRRRPGRRRMAQHRGARAAVGGEDFEVGYPAVSAPGRFTAPSSSPSPRRSSGRPSVDRPRPARRLGGARDRRGAGDHRRAGAAARGSRGTHGRWWAARAPPREHRGAPPRGATDAAALRRHLWSAPAGRRDGHPGGGRRTRRAPCCGGRRCGATSPSCASAASRWSTWRPTRPAPTA